MMMLYVMKSTFYFTFGALTLISIAMKSNTNSHQTNKL